jgi:hypothetical protein
LRAVLELDIHSYPQLFDLELRCPPVDADPLAGRMSLLGGEVG